MFWISEPLGKSESAFGQVFRVRHDACGGGGGNHFTALVVFPSHQQIILSRAGHVTGDHRQWSGRFNLLFLLLQLRLSLACLVKPRPLTPKVFQPFCSLFWQGSTSRRRRVRRYRNTNAFES